MADDSKRFELVKSTILRLRAAIRTHAPDALDSMQGSLYRPEDVAALVAVLARRAPEIALQFRDSELGAAMDLPLAPVELAFSQELVGMLNAALVAAGH